MLHSRSKLICFLGSEVDQVLNTLKFMHQKAQLVHRDISLSNMYFVGDKVLPLSLPF